MLFHDRTDAGQPASNRHMSRPRCPHAAGPYAGFSCPTGLSQGGFCCLLREDVQWKTCAMGDLNGALIHKGDWCGSETIRPRCRENRRRVPGRLKVPWQDRKRVRARESFLFFDRGQLNGDARLSFLLSFFFFP
jgi:hypothetical protein